MSLVVTPWVVRSGNWIAFTFEDTPGGNPQRVTAITGAPVVLKNSIPVTLPTPTWAGAATGNYGSHVGLIAYKLPSTALNTDVFTYSASSGWCTANAQAAPVATNASIANYVGTAVEPAFAIPAKTMQLGYNVNWPSGASFNNYHVQFNLIHCWPGSLNNVVTFDSLGHPLTVSGTISPTLFATVEPNGVDTKAFPVPTGMCTLRADESNPGSPFTVKLSVAGSLKIPTIIPGVLVGGVEVGKQFVWNVVRPAITTWNLNLQLQFTPPAVGTVPYTLSNEVFYRPTDNIADYTQTYQPCQTIIDWLTVGGSGSYCNRHADCILGFDGISCIVNAADSSPANMFAWGGRSTKIAITSVEPYSVATSPNIYFQDSFGIASPAPPGSPGPYMVSPANANFLTAQLGAGWAMYRVVTAAPHGLSAMQNPTAPTTLGAIQLTSGSGNYTSGNLNANTQIQLPTDANGFVTFAFVGASGGSTTGNAASVQAASGNYAMTIPGSNVIPLEAALALDVATGSHSWINIPLPAKITQSTDWATRALAIRPPGGKIFLELCNEVWSGSAQGVNAAKVMAAVLGLPSWQQFYVGRANEHHNEWFRVFDAAGRGSEIVRVISGQYANVGITTSLVNAMNALQVPVDVFAVGAYIDIDTSPSMQAAAASWQVGDLLDLQRHMIWFNSNLRGTASWYAGHATALSHYSVTVNGSPYPTPGLCGYEGSVEKLVSSNAGALVHDCNYHPHVKDLQDTFLYTNQLGGMEFLNYYCLSMLRQNGNAWADYASEIQTAGVGDGSDGLAVNQFATAQGGSPADGFSHDGPDAVNPLGNVAPKALSNRQWIQAVGGITFASMTGPGTATVNLPSSNFTITPSTTWTGTITPSDSGAGGTFTPTSLSWSATSNSQTFTYTPASIGVISISVAGSPTIPIVGSPISLNVLASTVATLTGPSTAAQGVASSPFSVTPSAPWTGTITPDDGGQGGTFTPSSLTWSMTNNTQTFTYTAATSGTISISATGSPSLTVNGSPISLVVAAPPPPPVIIWFIDPLRATVLH